MEVAHYYHLFAAGEGWEEAVADHNLALERGEWEGTTLLGIVGYPKERNLALALMDPPTNVVAEATIGWEQVTLKEVHKRALLGDVDAIMYAHTKGAAAPHNFNREWRRSMEERLVARWKDCAEILSTGYDAIGSHWLCHADYPQMTGTYADGFFAGNFWMATSEYLASLPPPPTKNRYQAESWVGLNKPKAYDLLPGWPMPEVWNREARA